MSNRFQPGCRLSNLKGKRWAASALRTSSAGNSRAEKTLSLRIKSEHGGSLTLANQNTLQQTNCSMFRFRISYRVL